VNVISLGFRTDLMVRRLAGSVIADRPSRLLVRTPANPGFWWGNFLLFAGPPRPGDAARWAATFAAELPDARHVAIGVDDTDGDAGDSAELAAAGLALDLGAVLTATGLTPPARPAAHAVIRPLAGDAEWGQALDLRQACYDSGTADEDHLLYLTRQNAEMRRLAEAGHGAWFGAFVDGVMRAGAGLFGDGDGLARFQSVETHPDFRRQGLAGTLLHSLGSWGVQSRGARRLVIVADPGYHAIDLYRALGFTDVEFQVQLVRASVPADIGD
jgi:ribosomal protein S18 acetylase RimI-like enzyme